MNILDLLLHLLGFFLPAFALAAGMVLAGRWLAPGSSWRQALAVHVVVGAAVLVAGLVLFGRDGKMATYAALVLAAATAQWFLGRGWRR